MYSRDGSVECRLTARQAITAPASDGTCLAVQATREAILLGNGHQVAEEEGEGEDVALGFCTWAPTRDHSRRPEAAASCCC